MTKQLYLVRHGETVLNVEGVLQGSRDSALTEQGTAQAKRVGDYFKQHGIAFDHAYSSPIGRAQATMRLITTMPYECSDGLTEWAFGDLEGARIADLPTPPWSEYFAQHGGESQQQVRDRAVKTLRAIMDTPGNNCVLVVSHGAVCGEFLQYWGLGRCASVMQGRLVPGNCSIMRFDYADGTFALQEIVEQSAM